MSTINYSATVNSAFGQKAFSIQWTLPAVNDDGSPVESPLADRSVQVTATFSGSTVTIQGSNDGTNCETITDPLGSALTFTGAGLKQILQYTKFIRPIATGGTGTNFVVTLVMR